ncbi:MAG TPA: MFS transporter [Anaerolineales bacterium]|nr:MFS transporter [Anaerolineales bacterium]
MFNLPRAYWLLFFGTLINRIGGFVVPFLTLYLTNQRSIPISQAGLVVSLFGAGSFLAQLIGGELTDRFGRKPVLSISFLITPVFIILLGFAQNIWIIATCTFFVGIFTDLHRPAVSAAIADIVPAADRPRAYGYIYWAINLGAAIAPVLAGFLAGYNYLFLFLGDGLTTLLFGLLVLFGFRETRPAEAAHHAAHTSPAERIQQLTRAPILLWFSFITLFFGIIYMQGYVTLPIDMQSHGLGPEKYGLTIAVNGIMIVLLTIPISNMAVKWPRFETISIAAIFIAIGFGFTAFADTFALFAVSVIIWTIGEIAATSVAPSIIADLAPVELRGLYQGIFGSAWGLSFFIGPILGSWVYQTFGAAALWSGCFILGLVLSASYFVLGKFSKSQARLELG